MVSASRGCVVLALGAGLCAGGVCAMIWWVMGVLVCYAIVWCVP